jgi:hypothetical protein
MYEINVPERRGFLFLLCFQARVGSARLVQYAMCEFCSQVYGRERFLFESNTSVALLDRITHAREKKTINARRTRGKQDAA